MNEIHNIDCMEYMGGVEDGSFNLTLTDIPYNAINRESNGLRSLDKDAADVATFDLLDFLEQVYRVTKGTIIIFCGKEQLSTIYEFFDHKQREHLGTVRQIVWRKTNPSPMNGQYVYLSGVENAVWFKKKGSTFNAHCKNTVFDYPCGRSRIHPTEKNHGLIQELIQDNSSEGDIVFDPCAGSGSHCLVALKNNRMFVGCEINDTWCDIARDRIREHSS